MRKNRKRAFFEDDNEEDFLIASLMNMPNTFERTGRGGSHPGRSPNLPRDHQAGHRRIMRDYFEDNPVYNDRLFRRRFRMRRCLFLRIVNAVKDHDKYFTQRSDALGNLGLSSIQKVTAAIRQLAYGVAADTVDEYIRIGESTATECLKRFCLAICEIFEMEYLREPNETDVKRLLEINKARGWPGMLGSLDCMHWEWKNCPTAWSGQFQGKEQTPTVVLEAVASYDLWFWHAFFGTPGSCNDINVLDRSPLFDNIIEGRAPAAKFTINNREYNMCYYLADGIYPSWATFVQTISHPQDAKRKHFAKMQEAARKDVERAFGVLQAQFAIVRIPCRLWAMDAMKLVMKTVIILHNMIVEDERDEQNLDFNYDAAVEEGILRDEVVITTIAQRYRTVQNEEKHYQLRNDLIFSRVTAIYITISQVLTASQTP